MTKSEKQIKEMVQAITTKIGSMSRNELRAIIKTAKGFTTTNCWWACYNAKNLIIDFAEDRLEITKRVRKKKPKQQQ